MGKRWTGVLACAVLLVVAGSCAKKKAEAVRAAPTTTTTTVAPTTTVKTVGTAPLTGLETADRAVLTRPALVVKIDNADPEARPQSGLAQADVVYEEQVEGNVTRLAAIFQTSAPTVVGPVRSARTTDVAIVTPLHRPLYAWSGANGAFARIIRSSPLVDAGYDAMTFAYSRKAIVGHAAPHNLYVSAPALFAKAPAGSQPPPPLFTYRDRGVPMPDGKPVSSVRLSFGPRGVPIVWNWDAKRHAYLRTQRGSLHVDQNGAWVNAANVVIQFVDYRDTGFVDVSGAPVPEAVLVGTGPCWILSSGRLVEGTWSKASPEAVTTYTDASGKPIPLTRGKTWVELPPSGGATPVG